MKQSKSGIELSARSITVNVGLAVVKIVTGIAGNSYALVADGIESTVDVVSSIVVWSGLRIAARPPDRTHPFGHGKAESMAALASALALIGSAVLIAVLAIFEIRAPHHAPAAYTLVVLAIVVVIKETMYRVLRRAGRRFGSTALSTDGWHHRSDALTSLAAFVGISIALLGGPGYEPADDWAALVACTIITYNGLRLLRPAIDEVMDAAVPDSIQRDVHRVAMSVPGVRAVEKSRIRKSGVGLLMDIHVWVDGDISVREGHEIARAVKARLQGAPLNIHDAVVHVEPDLDADQRQ